MLPKVKPLPKKPTKTKKETTAATAMPPLPAVAASSAATFFSIKAEDPLMLMAHYYADGV